MAKKKIDNEIFKTLIEDYNINHSSKYDFWILRNECEVAASRYRIFCTWNNFCDNGGFDGCVVEVLRR